jgi:hypothetical protein
VGVQVRLGDVKVPVSAHDPQGLLKEQESFAELPIIRFHNIVASCEAESVSAQLNPKSNSFSRSAQFALASFYLEDADL